MPVKYGVIGCGAISQRRHIPECVANPNSKLIGLAAYARKAHFHYDQVSGVYLLESLVEIPNFLKVTLPAWRRTFTVELDEKAGHLLKGTRAIEVSDP